MYGKIVPDSGNTKKRENEGEQRWQIQKHRYNDADRSLPGIPMYTLPSGGSKQIVEENTWNLS